MLKELQMGLRACYMLASRVWTCICFLLKRKVRAVSLLLMAFDIFLPKLTYFEVNTYYIIKYCGILGNLVTRLVEYLYSYVGRYYIKIVQHQPVKYELYPLSPLSRHRLNMVKRKVLVLDLDETLIHSHHDTNTRPTVKPGMPPDFILKVTIERNPVRFFVHKRPHVDFFLDIVSQWYELVVFTASMEIYGAGVADKLDDNRGILKRRYYRQHCTPELGTYTKDLAAVQSDLASIFILDNSPGAYRSYPDNAIPIKSWFSDPMDTALLNLLPVLDALRFTNDVRSVLGRNLHLHRIW
ncbi:CTD nuclear envelope phosphatase 1 homolog isoform X1 [Halyomorpha halys]|uniref:CTD nuclear envelope phosphatase 1 homolog isoform X1 n=1 Tax=Halyomorpha halys TaxID=286706 RepID=UPI0006D4CA2D|nr:CTD nuclear envelope phosphatase 1 homolog isoform X1 [Halyomorpha halys]